MGNILGISGSLRSGSYNTALLRAARQFLPEIELGDISAIPLYNADLEATGFPESVSVLKQQLVDASGVLLVSPEYNSSFPGVLKNAIDWLSRPSSEVRNAFQDKPLALIGASPGGFGTILAQNAWLPVFRSLGARHWSGGRLMVSGANRVFDENGNLVDEEVRRRLELYLQEFVKYCEL